MKDFEVVTAKCPQCKKIKTLSFTTGEVYRLTWCINCGEPVLWEKIGMNEDEVQEENDPKVKEAFDILRDALQKDDSYAWGWHCNIAMASYDEGLNHKSANRAAARFMQNCFGIDTTEFSEYEHIMSKWE